MSLDIGQTAPEFSLPATSNQQITLNELRGKNIVLYFYPKDNTPGCTTEGQNFGHHHQNFSDNNCLIFGISRDTLNSHEKFKCSQSLPFELISDTDETLCRLFDVIKQKNMYGKQVEGIERSTFLIDINGVIRQIWRKVKVEGHVDEVLSAVKALNLTQI